MNKLINQEGLDYALIGDIQKEVFDNIFLESLNNKLAKLFGEYASVNSDVINTNKGGYVSISFEMDDISYELVNFSNGILSETLDLIPEICYKNISSLIDSYELTANVKWCECTDVEVDLFLHGEEFAKYIKESDLSYLKEIETLLNTLKFSIKENVKKIMEDAVKEFSNYWYYNSSSLLDEFLLEA
jgi:hypothetical protein